jgi:uncharacterized membrane protein
MKRSLDWLTSLPNKPEQLADLAHVGWLTAAGVSSILAVLTWAAVVVSQCG